jgi:hypothetical protein
MIAAAARKRKDRDVIKDVSEEDNMPKKHSKLHFSLATVCLLTTA